VANAIEAANMMAMQNGRGLRPIWCATATPKGNIKTDAALFDNHSVKIIVTP